MHADPWQPSLPVHCCLLQVVELSGITFSEDGCLTSDTQQGTVVQARGRNLLLQPELRHAGGRKCTAVG